ncbi:glycosyltransferase [Candidatus Thiothrix anitrata]|uniref:Glycosyltransferase family 4 protein n=1 Tax=Candidatus Thiothrix anitrata TaxID=2823902 RepID=A0ABX7X4T5_9GAMM|nr:glycosyltransferase [Candidatus Thiothrix anitrata]QTR48839.1 glycosyltransferase family 4 protein [Candidatus Thiothrix anitrata]
MTRRLIYLHCLSFPSESGQTIQVLRDYYAMLKHDFEIHLFYLLEKENVVAVDMKQELSKFGLAENSSFHLHGITGKHKSRGNLIDLATGLLRVNDILIVRTMDHALDALKIRNKVKKTKVLMELHETAIPHLIYFENKRWLRGYISYWRERYIFSRVNALICTAQPQADLLDKLFSKHATKLVLPNAVPDEWLSKKSDIMTQCNDSSFHLRYAGQFSKWKNTEILFEALSLLPDNFILDLAGGKSCDQSLTAIYINDLATKYKVNDRVNYVGVLQPTSVIEFISSANLLLLPLGNNVQSMYFTSPMKIFEYAISGVAAIIASQPTTRSLVSKSQVAFFDGNSAKSLAAKINYLYLNPDLRLELAKNFFLWVRLFL